MFKKSLLVTSICLTLLSGIANATPKSGQIINCGKAEATLRFKVYDTGWYYVSVPDDKDKSGWYFSTPLTVKNITVKNTTNISFAVITDMETQTTLSVTCATDS